MLLHAPLPARPHAEWMRPRRRALCSSPLLAGRSAPRPSPAPGARSPCIYCHAGPRTLDAGPAQAPAGPASNVACPACNAPPPPSARPPPVSARRRYTQAYTPSAWRASGRVGTSLYVVVTWWSRGGHVVVTWWSRGGHVVVTSGEHVSPGGEGEVGEAEGEGVEVDEEEAEEQHEEHRHPPHRRIAPHLREKGVRVNSTCKQHVNNTCKQQVNDTCKQYASPTAASSPCPAPAAQARRWRSTRRPVNKHAQARPVNKHALPPSQQTRSAAQSTNTLCCPVNKHALLPSQQTRSAAQCAAQ
jgi:hypothetical protein